MKTTLMAFTALAGILAIPGGAVAQGNFQPPKPMIQPQVVRPVITPRVDTSRLTKDLAPVEIPEADKPDAGEQAAGQPGPTDQTSLGVDVAPKPLPDSGRVTGMRRTPALAFAPLPEERPGGGIAEGSPQPEPPTLPSETAGVPEDGRLPGLDGLAGEAGHLGLLEEAARLKDIEEAMAGPGSAGGSLGGAGGGQQGPSGWRDMVPEGNTGEAQAPELWSPGLPGTAAYNPGAEQGGGFTPPPRKPRGAGNIPGFGSTAGSAGPSLGRDGRTGQDVPEKREDGMRVESEDSRGFTYVTLVDKHGRMRGFQIYSPNPEMPGETRLTDEYHFDRNYEPTARWRYRYDDEGNVYRIEEDLDENDPDVVHLPEHRVTGDPDADPDRQPAPDAPLAAGSMPCPATHRDCGAGAEEVSRFEKVAQPGRGDEGGTEQGFKASIEERTDVVTNPVDPGTQLMTGGGGQGPRPIEHVTKPGKE